MDRQTWRRLRWYGPWIAVPVGLVAFFVIYNRVAVDRSLHNLTVTLNVLEQAGTVEQAEAAVALIDQQLLTMAAAPEAAPQEMAALEYSRGVVLSDPERRVEDAQVFIATLVAQRRQARGALRILDTLNDALLETVQRAALWPRGVFGHAATSEAIDLDSLREAVRAERDGHLLEASRGFEELIKRFPEYQGRDQLQLRLGYLYERQQSWTSAERLYREVASTTHRIVESEVAHQLLDQLAQARRELHTVTRLQHQVAQTTTAAARQQTAFDLGVAQMRARAFEDAAQSFQLAAAAQPQTALALQAQFHQAWSLQYAGQHAAAERLYDQLAPQVADTPLAPLVHTQQAESYRAQGRFEAAAETLEAVSQRTHDGSLAAIALAQTASIYLMDLQNDAQAQAFFRRLEALFPASPFSTMPRMIRLFQLRKPGLYPAASSRPVAFLGGLGDVFQSFVEVFATRLAQYMRNTHQTTLQRRLTETDFQRLVVRWLQDRAIRPIDQVEATISREGFQGSGLVRLGFLWVPVAGRVRVMVVQERPHIEILRLTLWRLPLPLILRQFLAAQVNAAVDRTALPLRVQRFDQIEGAVEVHVALRKAS